MAGSGCANKEVVPTCGTGTDGCQYHNLSFSLARVAKAVWHSACGRCRTVHVRQQGDSLWQPCGFCFSLRRITLPSSFFLCPLASPGASFLLFPILFVSPCPASPCNLLPSSFARFCLLPLSFFSLPFLPFVTTFGSMGHHSGQ